MNVTEQKELMSLYESIVVLVECDICGKIEYGHDIGDIHFADDLYHEGWRTHDEIVRCPECKGKRKKKLRSTNAERNKKV